MFPRRNTRVDVSELTMASWSDLLTSPLALVLRGEARGDGGRQRWALTAAVLGAQDRELEQTPL